MRNTTKICIRVSDIPAVYSISRSKVYRMAKAGTLTIHRLGGASLVKVTDLEALIEGAEV